MGRLEVLRQQLRQVPFLRRNSAQQFNTRVLCLMKDLGSPEKSPRFIIKREAICLVILQDNLSQEEQINQFRTKKNVAQMRMI